MPRLFTILIAALTLLVQAPAPARAQQPAELPVGACEPATAEAFLDIGNVRAKILNNGALFWNGGRTFYEVPKGSGYGAIFMGNLWIGGLVNDSLHVAAGSYGPFEFWPGPLADAMDPPDDCSSHDRIWMLEQPQTTRGPEPTTARRDSIRELARAWPVDLGAPYEERNDSPGYQPDDGDVPLMRGDQTAWWVMNDSGNSHDQSGSSPLGIEVRGEAWAFDVNGPVRDATFYRYTVINRSGAPIDSLFIGLWTDVDLGSAFDDVAGTDTTLSLIYSFNFDNEDDIYGVGPPAVGTTLLDVDLASDPGDGLSSGGDTPSFSNTVMHYEHGWPLAYPHEAEHYYWYLQSRMNDGNHIRVGEPRTPAGTEADFFFPGDPVTGEYWSAVNIDNMGTTVDPSDMRTLGSAGPFDLAAVDTLRFAVSIVWARGSDHLDSIAELRSATTIVRQAADGVQELHPVVLVDPPTEHDPSPQPEPRFFANIHPNPASGTATLSYNVPYDMEGHVAVFEALGRRMAVVDSGALSAGPHERSLDVSAWPPGVYVVQYRFDHVLEHVDETRTFVVQ